MPNNIWYFRRGLPVKYTGPALNATQNNVAIESIEIAHEGIHQVPPVAWARRPWRRIGRLTMEVQISDLVSTIRGWTATPFSAADDGEDCARRLAGSQ